MSLALTGYFAGEDIRLSEAEFDKATEGLSEFTKTVLRAVCEIPRGTTITYSELARRLGCPKSVRAVASALGRNKLPVLIPCHRVVGASGIGGYAYGVDLKRALLDFENPRNCRN